MNKVIDGREHAEKILKKLGIYLSTLRLHSSIVPGLAVILVGNDEASKIYVRNKVAHAQGIGIYSEDYKLPYSTTQSQLLTLIQELNASSSYHGILVQLPLPEHISTSMIINAISPKKDVDCFHPTNIGLLYHGKPVFEPCTPQGVMLLLKSVLGKNLASKNAVVLGRSIIVGKPMFLLLLQANCSVTVLHSKSANKEEICSKADIVVSAVGQKHMIKSNWLKRGACIIDVGLSKYDGVLYGDVDFEEVYNKIGYISPVPGGVGPMTITCLMLNTVKAACLQNNLKFALPY